MGGLSLYASGLTNGKGYEISPVNNDNIYICSKAISIMRCVGLVLYYNTVT